jgi:hypothetical protein
MRSKTSCFAFHDVPCIKKSVRWKLRKKQEVFRSTPQETIQKEQYFLDSNLFQVVGLMNLH